MVVLLAEGRATDHLGNVEVDADSEDLCGDVGDPQVVDEDGVVHRQLLGDCRVSWLLLSRLPHSPCIEPREMTRLLMAGFMVGGGMRRGFREVR